MLGIELIAVALALAACAATPDGSAVPGSSVAQASAIATAAPSPGKPTVAPSLRKLTAPSPQATEVPTMPQTAFTLTSTAFSDGGSIPRRFTCDGENASPDLAWSGAPEATRALALVVTDPDARDFVHWIVLDVTGTPAGGLPTAVSASADTPRQGTNSFGSPGYGGPCPPSGEHHYVFALFALDGPLELTGAPRLAEVQAAMDGHVIATTTLNGTYHR